MYPPVYFHDGFGQELMVPLLSTLFGRLKKTGFRVILGISGHNVREQLDIIEEGLAPVVADGTIRGAAMFEVMPDAFSEECGGDHAAKWETSNMMFFYPRLVDLAALGTKPLAPDMKWPDGIGGLDPREHASAGVGRRNVEHGVRAIGEKARELLLSLPEEDREFALPGIKPEHWWYI